MFTRLFAVVLGLSFLLTQGGFAGDDGGKKAKKGHGVRGVVEAVQKDKDKDTGFIVINVHAKKGQPVEGDKDRKFTVTADTKFERVIHISKGNNQKEPASFKDVAKGEHVVIVPSKDKKDVAQAVAIVVRKK